LLALVGDSVSLRTAPVGSPNVGRIVVVETSRDAVLTITRTAVQLAVAGLQDLVDRAAKSTILDVTSRTVNLVTVRLRAALLIRTGNVSGTRRNSVDSAVRAASYGANGGPISCIGRKECSRGTADLVVGIGRTASTSSRCIGTIRIANSLLLAASNIRTTSGVNVGNFVTAVFLAIGASFDERLHATILGTGARIAGIVHSVDPLLTVTNIGNELGWTAVFGGAQRILGRATNLERRQPRDGIATVGGTKSRTTMGGGSDSENIVVGTAEVLFGPAFVGCAAMNESRPGISDSLSNRAARVLNGGLVGAARSRATSQLASSLINFVITTWTARIVGGPNSVACTRTRRTTVQVGGRSGITNGLSSRAARVGRCLIVLRRIACLPCTRDSTRTASGSVRRQPCRGTAKGVLHVNIGRIAQRRVPRRRSGTAFRSIVIDHISSRTARLGR